MSEPNAAEKEDPLFAGLTEDYDKCAQALEREDTQFWRRTLFRTMFSLIEAMNGVLKEKAIQAACSGDKKRWNITKIELLGDYEYRILKTGKLERETLRRPFLNYTAFILRCIAEESYTEPSFFAHNGWNEFQKAIDVRHRLTHPKKDTDMTVTDEELRSLQEAFRWYHNAIAAALGNKSFWTGPFNEPI